MFKNIAGRGEEWVGERLLQPGGRTANSGEIIYHSQPRGKYNYDRSEGIADRIISNRRDRFIVPPYGTRFRVT